MRIKKVFIDLLKHFFKFKPKKVNNYLSRTNVFNKSRKQIIEQKYIFKKIKKYHKKKILDYGCNDCFFSTIIDKKIKYYGVDNNKELLNKKLKIYSKNFLFLKKTKIPFRKEYFDCVLLSHVLPHIYNSKSLIEEIKRVLKKNGILIIVCPNKIFKFFYFFLNIFNNYIPDETISKHFSSKNVQDLFDNNWKLLETNEYSIQKKIKKKYLNSRFIIIFKKL
jgi:ubiquinone/menaquinone biosynthesis C-methylase UbiE